MIQVTMTGLPVLIRSKNCIEAINSPFPMNNFKMLMHIHLTIHLFILLCLTEGSV